MISARPDRFRGEGDPRRGTRFVSRLSIGAATLVLALAMGVSPRSARCMAEHIVPEPDEGSTPYLGI